MRPFGFIPAPVVGAPAAVNAIVATGGLGLATAVAAPLVLPSVGSVVVVAGATLGVLAILEALYPAQVATGTLPEFELPLNLPKPEPAVLPPTAVEMLIDPPPGVTVTPNSEWLLAFQKTKFTPATYDCVNSAQLTESSFFEGLIPVYAKGTKLKVSYDTARLDRVCSNRTELPPDKEVLRVEAFTGTEWKFQYNFVLPDGVAQSQGYFTLEPLVESYKLAWTTVEDVPAPLPEPEPEPKIRPLPIIPQPLPEPEPEPEPQPEPQPQPEPVPVPSPATPEAPPYQPEPLPPRQPQPKPRPQPLIAPTTIPLPTPVPKAPPIGDPDPATAPAPLPQRFPTVPQPAPLPANPTKIAPDGKPMAAPVPAVQPTPTTTHFPVAGQPGIPVAGANPNPVQVAQEVARIEGKLGRVMNQGTGGGGAPSLAELLLLLETLLSYFQPNVPGDIYRLVSVCETDSDGEPISQSVEEIIPSADSISAILYRLDALVPLLQGQKDFKQPICREKVQPQGDYRTISFISDETSTAGRNRLRKRFRYRSQSGLGLGEVVDHWKDFVWQAGPVCVQHSGHSWGTPQVWAASVAEGKRVIQHAGREAGVDPDQVGKWTVSGSDNPRFGMPGTMRVNTKGGYYWITERLGSSGRPYVVSP